MTTATQVQPVGKKASTTQYDHSKRPFGIRDIIGYFFGDFGCNMSFSLISSFMFIFYTQYIGIKLTHYSLIILITKIFDGINDPIVGALIDRFTPKDGQDKFKPWIKWGGIILSFSAAVMFIDSSGWSYTARLLICTLSYILWDICYTFVNVPYGSLNAVMTVESKERTKLSTARSFGGLTGGSLIGFLIPIFAYGNRVVNGETKSIFLGERMFAIAVFLGVMAIISFYLTVKNVEERVVHVTVADDKKEELPKQKFSYINTLKNFIRNRAIVGLSFVVLSLTIFIMGAGQLNTMTYQLYFKDGTLTSYSMLTRLIPLFVGMAIAPSLTEKYGKKACVGYPSLVAAIIFGLMAFLPIKNLFIWIGLQVIANTVVCIATVAGWAMVSDAIDYQELKTGERNEGSIYATYSMIRKIGQGIGSALVPAAIAFLIPGLDVADASTWSAEYANQIKILSAVFPMLGFFFQFIGYQFIYPIGKKEELEIEQAMKS